MQPHRPRAEVSLINRKREGPFTAHTRHIVGCFDLNINDARFHLPILIKCTDLHVDAVVMPVFMYHEPGAKNHPLHMIHAQVRNHMFPCPSFAMRSSRLHQSSFSASIPIFFSPAAFLSWYFFS